MDIIEKIKLKKELSGVQTEVVKELVSKLLRKYNLSFPLKSRDEKIIIKEARKELRLMVGRFRSSTNKEDSVTLHSSTRERSSFYPELKKIISQLAPKSILDIGCGLNPLVLAKKDLVYYACDIDETSLNTVRDYFSENNIKGQVFSTDIRKIPKLPKADLILIFKVLDIIESKTHILSEKLIDSLDFKHLLISFPTIKLSGRKMQWPRRRWLETLLSRKNFSYEVFFSDNEIFYLIKR